MSPNHAPKGSRNAARRNKSTSVALLDSMGVASTLGQRFKPITVTKDERRALRISIGEALEYRVGKFWKIEGEFLRVKRADAVHM